jgi:hypothetical protein
MITQPRQSSILLVCGLILAYILLGLLISSPVQADVGVQPILPGGSDIKPEGETPIQMTEEVVTMNVRPATEADNTIIQLNPAAYGLQFEPVWYPMVAEVQAVFTMTNPTTDNVSLTAWFPLASALESVSWEINPDEIVPRIASFHVAVDGNPIDYSVKELPNPKGADKPPLPWASFPVTFPAGKETMIQVSYLLPLQTAVKGSELALYYIFQTGAGWAGPIGQAELFLNLPYPASSDTMARIPPKNLGLPYAMSDPNAIIPSGGVMEGNQARWTWTNFEPGPEDDFSIWLMDPGKWQELEEDRTAVLQNPEDGQAWLNLANVYRTLSLKAYNFPGIFSASYLSPGLEAYQKATELLPEHPAPHVGLAMLSLAPYMTDTNAPSEVMGFVQEQLRIARELETAHPNLAEQADISSWLLEDALNVYFYDITATAVSGATSTGWARETETAALLVTPSETSTPEPSFTSTMLPSKTPEPLPSITATMIVAQPENFSRLGQNELLIIVIIVVVLVIIGYLVLKKSRSKTTK